MEESIWGIFYAVNLATLANPEPNFVTRYISRNHLENISLCVMAAQDISGSVIIFGLSDGKIARASGGSAFWSLCRDFVLHLMPTSCLTLTANTFMCHMELFLLQPERSLMIWKKKEFF